MIGTLNNKVKAILTAIMVIIVLASIAFFIIINVSPFFIHYPVQLGISQREIRRLYNQLLLYLQVPGIHYQHSALIKTSLTVAHFRDVKGYFLLNEVVMVLGILSLHRLLKKRKRRGQLWELLVPLQWLIMLLIVVFVMIAVDFPTFFIKGHYFLFNNMDWVISPANDPIILLMPVGFFTHLFYLWGMILLIFLIVFWAYISFRVGFLKFRTKITNCCRKKGNEDDRQDND